MVTSFSLKIQQLVQIDGYKTITCFYIEKKHSQLMNSLTCNTECKAQN